MAPFGWRYDDQRVAKLATHVGQAWGDGGQGKTVRAQLGVAQPRR